MPYVKDNLGNIVWVAGDDTSQQQQKMAGIAQQQAIANQQQALELQAGANKTARMVQPQAVQPSPTNPEVAGFAQGKQNYNIFAQKPAAAPVQPAGTVKNTNVGTGKVNTTDSKPYQAATETGGGATRPITNMDELAAAMGYTSPEQEERLRKASIANQRILAVADAIRHIGNIANTVRYAPSQQFNSPVQEEYARYERGKALRDKANLTYINYQQAKAAQDAKQKQWEMDFNLKVADAARKAGYTEAQIKNMQDRLAQQKAYQDANIALGNRRADDAKAANEARIKEQNRHNRVSEGQRSQSLKMQRERTTAYVNRAKNGGGTSNVAPLDTPKGQITPNGRSYSNQLLQMFDYAKSKGLVQESDVAKRLREMGFGKDQSDNVKRQMVMDLLRSNPDMGDYASSRLGWSYGGGTPSTDWDQYAEEEDDWSQYED